MENLPEILEKDRILVIVKPNSKKTRINSFDEKRDALKIDLSAPAHEGKANKELICFLHKKTKRQARILRGLKSKEKVVELF